MLMMVSLPGKERTEAEWRALYAAAGLAVTSITPINPRSGESLIEGAPRAGARACRTPTRCAPRSSALTDERDAARARRVLDRPGV
jgi:hypothetical protein